MTPAGEIAAERVSCRGSADLVLAGGGVKGIGHVDALEVLEERGYAPFQRVVGTSVGAIGGALASPARPVSARRQHEAPDSYPAAPPAQPQQRPPDIVDSIVGILASALADRMIEDLQTLDKLNVNVNGVPARLIPRLFVGPNTRRELGELAAKVYRERYHGRRVVDELDFRLLHALVGAGEKDNGELLSYMFFDKAFIEASIQLGIRYARNKTGGAAPWKPSSAVAQPAPTSTVP